MGRGDDREEAPRRKSGVTESESDADTDTDTDTDTEADTDTESYADADTDSERERRRGEFSAPAHFFDVAHRRAIAGRATPKLAPQERRKRGSRYQVPSWPPPHA